MSKQCRAGVFVLALLSMAGYGMSSRCASTPKTEPASRCSPNIVLFLTDDMDQMLGSWTPMNKTQRLLADQGATATNWMIRTPVCCPFRAQLLTGRYFHNLRVAKPSDGGCMHVNVSTQASAFYDQYYFAPHL